MLDTIENFVLSPAGKAFAYWGSMGLGGGMVLSGLANEMQWLTVIGLAFALAGFGGITTLRERLHEYSPQIRYQRRETPVQLQNPVREQIRVNTPKSSRTEEKRRDDVGLTYGRNQEFVFTGRNLDRLLIWLKEYGRSIRKVSSAAGAGFDQLPDSITAERYTDATAALLYWEYIEKQGQAYRWTNDGMEWLKEAGL